MVVKVLFTIQAYFPVFVRSNHVRGYGASGGADGVLPVAECLSGADGVLNLDGSSSGTVR